MEREVRFTLHAHEQSASGDSDTDARGMAEEYARQGYDLVGFVGHDKRPSFDTTDLPINVMTGVEHELRTDPTRLHIIKYPDQDLSILAHPKLTWPDNTEDNAVRTAMQHGVDAIELFNRGEKNLPEPSNDSFVRVAGDDAHNTLQIGGSYMTAMAEDATPETVTDKVKQGHVTLHNPGLPAWKYYSARLHQGVSMLGWYLSGN